ncbi:hypothetical protein K8S19_03315 [bacterium]|nr:hypothetical protein [bacterium]
MLGHPVVFKYCRTQADNTLCRHIRNCWFERLPIQDYLEKNYTPDQLNTLDAPPKPKTVSLFEMIEKAKKSMDHR